MSRHVSAEDILESAVLKVTMPAAAATPDVLRAIGAYKALGPGRGQRADRDGLVSIVIDRVDWSWEEEAVDAFDEDGNAVRIDTKTAYSIDGGDIDGLGHEARKCDQTLRALGIPFDLEWNNPLEGNAISRERGRLLSQDPRGYAKNADAPHRPSTEELLGLIEEASSLEELREWMGETKDLCAPLKDSASLFEQALQAPGQEAFLAAGAKFLQWGNKSRSYFASPTAWEPGAPDWIATLDAEGESPLQRFSRHGLTVGLPFIADCARLALKQEPPALDVAAQALDAYAKALDGARDIGVSDKAAELFADCAEARPEVLQKLAPATRAFLGFELRLDSAKRGFESSAMLEARWLRLQSALARPAAAPSASAARL